MSTALNLARERERGVCKGLHRGPGSEREKSDQSLTAELSSMQLFCLEEARNARIYSLSANCTYNSLRHRKDVGLKGAEEGARNQTRTHLEMQENRMRF